MLPLSENKNQLKAILHYAFGLRLGKVCDWKREKNAIGSRF